MRASCILCILLERDFFSHLEYTSVYPVPTMARPGWGWGYLTDTVRKIGTAEKWHLSNLNNTHQNFCPMMVLTIGHKKGWKNCPWRALAILSSISHEFWWKSNFAVDTNLEFWNWLRMLLLDWIIMRKRVFGKFPVCLHFWINPSYLKFPQFWQRWEQKLAALSTQNVVSWLNK